MITLLAVDGLNLIRRIYAVQEREFPATNQTEQLIHNVKQQTKSALSKLLNQFSPTHAVVVFDGDKPNWRKQLYPAYKENRIPMPELLAEHLDDIQAGFYELGVDSLLAESDKADDLIATLVCKLPVDRGETIIVSTDKDYLQLLTQTNVRIWHYFDRNWLDANHVEKKFGVTPEKLCEYFSLVGDSGHNIEGVSKVGAKTAAALLINNNLEEILHSHEFVAKYQPDIAEINLYKLLFKLKTDIQLSFHLRDIRVKQ